MPMSRKENEQEGRNRGRKEETEEGRLSGSSVS